MYRCKECGAEYEIKPDYCDCGNDEFEIFVAPLKEEPTEKHSDISNTTTQNTIKMSQNKNSSSKNYSEFDRIRKFFDPISTSIFLLCIILSIIVIVFVANPAPKSTKQEAVSQETVNIPSIDSFWDNSIPKAEKSVSTQSVEQVPSKAEKQETFLQKIAAPVQKISKPQQVKTAVQIPVKPQSQVQKSSQQPKKAQNLPATKSVVINQPSLVQNQKNTQPKQQHENNKNISVPDVSTVTQRVQNNAANSSVQNNNSALSMTSQTLTQQTQKQNSQSVSQMPVIRTTTQTSQNNSQSESTQVPAKTVDTAALKQELANYKVSLRNTIGKKINFTNVVGDGNCIITFKINSNGTLVNRQFSQKSSNITLNDAVYSAMTATPTFTAPPAGYKNETLHLKVNFYNGNFDITLY